MGHPLLCRSRAALTLWLPHTCRCGVFRVGCSMWGAQRTAAAAPMCHSDTDKQQLFLSSSRGRKDQPAIYFVQL